MVMDNVFYLMEICNFILIFSYEGYFKDDKFDGKGKMIFSDG